MRLVLFYDAGQVRDYGREVRVEGSRSPGRCTDPARSILADPGDRASWARRRLESGPTDGRQIGETSAFKTSTGAEIRFFMPVLNVPFRLIFA